MDINEINKTAYNLINLLFIKDLEKKNGNSVDRKKFIGDSECIGKIDVRKTVYFTIYETDILNNNISANVILDNKKVGLDRKNYQLLKNLVEELLNDNFIYENCDFEFIEKKVFGWIIEVYSKSKADFDLYNYLLLNIEKEKNDHIFYFKVNNLAIEDNFVVGNCEFKSLEENFFEERLIEINHNSINISEKDDEAFLMYNKSFLNKLLITTSFSGVHNKALSQAKKQVELSINALKIFLSLESLNKKNLFNVDFNDMNNDVTEYFSYTNNSDFHTIIGSKKSSAVPVEISSNSFNEFKKEGLENISEFLKNNKKNELYFEIESLINDYGNINSTQNLHIRLVWLVSFFERVIIPKSNTKGKGLIYLKNNILPKLINNFDAEIAGKVNTIYKIRDKYLHNRIELPIGVDSILMFKEIAKLFLLKLIFLNNSNCQTLEDVQRFFDISTSKNL